EDGDNRVAAPAQIHIVDALSAAPGDTVVVSRAPDPETLPGHAQHELLPLRQIDKSFFRDRTFALVGRLSFALLGFEGHLGSSLPLLVGLPPSPCCEAQISVTIIGSNLLVAQDRQRDHLIVAQQPDTTDADRGTAGEDPHITDREADRFTAACSE